MIRPILGGLALTMMGCSAVGDPAPAGASMGGSAQHGTGGASVSSDGSPSTGGGVASGAGGTHDSTAASSTSSAGGSIGSGGALGGSAGTTNGSGSGGAAPMDASAADGPSSHADAANDGARADAGRPILDASRDAYFADRSPTAPGVLVHVTNGCPFDLWLHGAGDQGVLMPDAAHLTPGAAQDYIAPDTWSAARITAYRSAPPNGEIDKVEITIANKVVNYNITYVDWVGLPIEMIAFGSGVDCKKVGCYVTVADLLSGCPDHLLAANKCLSAGNYCSVPANQSTPFCHALDSNVSQCATGNSGCAGATGATTAQAYSCSGFFASQPKWCAAVNRGMVADPDNQNASLYYKTSPFNTYASWVHTTCPGIYAFPYDDYGNPNESGFHSCTGATELNVTFCPGG